MPVKYTFRAILKFVIVLTLIFGTTGIFIYSYFYAYKGRAPRIDNIEPAFSGKDLLILPYTSKSYAGYGNVFEPEITMKIRDSKGQEFEVDFLLDSGAVVSTLPISYAQMLGKDIEDAKRIVLRGFGNQRSFGYMSEMNLVIKEELVSIPVVFSEGEMSKKILGRNVFFDEYTITFDHKDRVIRIRK